MLPRDAKIRALGVKIALVAMFLVSVSVQAAPPAPIACQEQDVIDEPAVLHDTPGTEEPAARLAPNLRRMYCTAQRIMAESTLKRRLPYEAVRQRAARAIEDIVTQLQLTTDAAEQSSVSAFARAFYAFLTLNATIASEALIADTPDEIAGAQALSDERGEAAFAQANAALQQVLAALQAAKPFYNGLRPNAFMTTWLVLGPIPVSQDQSHCPSGDQQRQAFDTDHLAPYGGVSGIAPKAGLVHTVDGRAYPWQLVRSESDIVDLIRVYDWNEFVIAYAWAEIEVPEATPLLLGIGSNDATKIWLNGELIHKNWVFRPVTKDEDIVPVTLRQGVNQILLKVQNGTYRWGFACRALGRDLLPGVFTQAAGQGKLETLTLLMSHGVDINAPNPSGTTGLHSARMRGRGDTVKFLLERGADQHVAMPPEEKLVEALFREAVDADTPGAAVLVARHGNILYQNGFGQASVQPPVPITPQTKFRIGSITKQFTASAILKLQKKGVLRVTDKLSTFLPDYPRGDEVTIHHLLTHTSGIKSYTRKPNFRERVVSYIEPKALIDSFKDDPYDFDPGEGWLYNNSGYFLLGYIVERVSGSSFADYLKRQFFVPLGMENTGVYHKDLTLSHAATGYRYKRGQLLSANDRDLSFVGGDGGLYSTIGDLFRWNEALWDGEVLSEASLKAAFEPVRLNNGSLPRQARYGYGWGIGEQRGLQMVAHNGRIGGFTSRLARYPKQNFTVTVLTNVRRGPPSLNVNRLADAVAEIYLWEDMEILAAMDADVAQHAYNDYVGQYAYAIMTVTRQGDRVFAQLTGQPKVEIFPESETEYYWKVVDARVRFVKDGTGRITHAHHFQGGHDFMAPKMNGTDAHAGITGRYAYKILTVTREDKRLFARLSGQQRFEIFPKSPTEFFWKVVDAQVEFVKNEKGIVTHAIHRQRGEFEAPKMN